MGKARKKRNPSRLTSWWMQKNFQHEDISDDDDLETPGPPPSPTISERPSPYTRPPPVDNNKLNSVLQELQDLTADDTDTFLTEDSFDNDHNNDEDIVLTDVTSNNKRLIDKRSLPEKLHNSEGDKIDSTEAALELIYQKLEYLRLNPPEKSKDYEAQKKPLDEEKECLTKQLENLRQDRWEQALSKIKPRVKPPPVAKCEGIKLQFLDELVNKFGQNWSFKTVHYLCEDRVYRWLNEPQKTIDQLNPNYRESENNESNIGYIRFPVVPLHYKDPDPDQEPEDNYDFVPERRRQKLIKWKNYYKDYKEWTKNHKNHQNPLPQSTTTFLSVDGIQALDSEITQTFSNTEATDSPFPSPFASPFASPASSPADTHSGGFEFSSESDNSDDDASYIPPRVVTIESEDELDIEVLDAISVATRAERLETHPLRQQSESDQ